LVGVVLGLVVALLPHPTTAAAATSSSEHRQRCNINQNSSRMKSGRDEPRADGE
jgi:hypothetical protein